MVEYVPLDDIFVDEALQTRALSGPTDPSLVEEYASDMTSGKHFPAIDVFEGDWLPPGKRYVVVDGFHRVAAAHLAREHLGVSFIHANIHAGTRRDALKFSVGANHTHGQRVSNADKRKKVSLLLDDHEWSVQSLYPDTVLADWAGVSSMFIGNMRREKAAALNGLTVAEEADRASEASCAKKASVLAAAQFAMPSGLFWDPRTKASPTPPSLKSWEVTTILPPPRPHLDLLADLLAMPRPQPGARFYIDEDMAERIIEKMGITEFKVDVVSSTVLGIK